MQIRAHRRAFQRKRYGPWYLAVQLSSYYAGWFYENCLEWDRAFPTEQEARQYADQWLAAHMA